MMDVGRALQDAEPPATVPQQRKVKKKKKKRNLHKLAMFGSTAEARQVYLDSAADHPTKRQRQRDTSWVTQDDFGGCDDDLGGGYDADTFDEIVKQRDTDTKPTNTSETPTAPTSAADRGKLSGKVRILEMPSDEEEDEEANKDAHLISAAAVMSSAADWRTVREQAAQLTAPTPAEVVVDTTAMPVVQPVDEDDPVFRFYWLDACEGENRTAGTIYLFGKVWVQEANTFVSCCVHVMGMQRDIFCLPRSDAFLVVVLCMVH